MKANDLINAVKDFFEEHLSPVHRITAISNKGNYWEVGVEMIEEKEYMKRYGRDQLVGTYMVRVNSKNEVTSFERTALRQRTSTDIYQEQEAE
ncbi:gas vesicle protein GvpO [Alkalicoccus luteus]|uniref:Gas vesicle protein GvpR n=1 Tax=Alkalicoccus luteus TaxID=1237094 RepID=A0A969PP85_9BACI|nr:gas vesicle protein GvpR [Alkalicoccus luteus]